MSESVSEVTKNYPKMKSVDSLSFLQFRPKGHIPKKVVNDFKKKHPDCFILEEKDGRYTIRLNAVKVEASI